MKKFLCGMAALAIFAGCASKDVKEQPAAAVEERRPSVGEVTPEVKKPTGPVVIQQPPAKTITANPLTDPGSILSKRSIFYDYDSDVIKDEFKPVVTAHGQYLAQNRSARVAIQGNTDERGSREYNLALGQRRADSVKKMMMLLGAQESQIEAVSFGEEKPRATGTDEAAFSQNRRSDIVYAGEQ